MGLCVAIGVGAGVWLDKRLGTEPWLTLIGTVLGSIAAFRELFIAVAHTRGSDDE